MSLGSMLESLGASLVNEMPQKSRWAVQRNWRRVFAGEWLDWSGPLADMDWHVFSYKCVDRLEEAAAILAFEARSETRLIAAANLAHGPMFSCLFPHIIAYRELRNAWRSDLYLMDESMTWTFVLTHEDSLGPYFVQRLNDSNHD